MRSTEEMTKFLLEKLKKLFKQNHLQFVYLGGSWARGENQWWSDIDLFVSFPKYPDLSPDEQLRVLTKLHLDATDLTKLEEINFIIIETLPLHVQFNVISEGIVIYEESKQTREDFIEKLLPLYYDHKIWYEKLILESDYET